MAIARGPFTRSVQHVLASNTGSEVPPVAIHRRFMVPARRAAEKSFPESWLRRALLTEREILLDWARLGEAANGFLEAPNDTLKASRREEHV